MRNYENYSNQSKYQYTPTSTLAVTSTTPACSITPTAYNNDVETRQVVYTATAPKTINVATNTPTTNTPTVYVSTMNTPTTNTPTVYVSTVNTPTVNASSTLNVTATTSKVPTKTYDIRTIGAEPAKYSVTTFAPTITSCVQVTSTVSVTPNPSDHQAYVNHFFSSNDVFSSIATLKNEGYSFCVDLTSKKVEYSAPSGFVGDIVCDIIAFKELYDSLPIKISSDTITYQGVTSGGVAYDITVGKIKMPGNQYDTWSPSAATEGYGFNIKFTF